ncbi:MAG: biotin/lipoyl-containing protein [Desulfobaccales bacterium]|nr:biotin/lipoyl-containing protein [Desulfobaccales bacterium]
MRRYRITIGDKVYEVEIVALRGDQARVVVNGRPYEVKFSPAGGAPVTSRPPSPAPKPMAAPAPAPLPPPMAPPSPTLEKGEPRGDLGSVVAPMPGAILEVLVKVGDRVQVGDTVVKLEAMKMENDLVAPMAGVVTEVRVSKGSNVAVGEVLVVLSP